MDRLTRLALTSTLAATLTSIPALARADDDVAALRQQARNERAAIGALKLIASTQSLFREGDKDQNGQLDYAGSLEALVDAKLLDAGLKDGEQGGYVFVVQRSQASPEFMWAATAAPKSPGKTGRRCFAINHAGVVMHALKPFAPGDDCKLPDAAIPVDKPLQGYDPTAGQLPQERALLVGARAKLRMGDQLLRSSDGAVFLGFQALGYPDSWKADALWVRTKGRLARMESAVLFPDGQPRELMLGVGRLGERKPDSTERGGLLDDGRTIVLKGEDGKERKGVLEDGMLPRALALLVLPRLAQRDELRLPLKLTLLEDAFAEARPVYTLEALVPAPAREGAGPKEQAYALGDRERKTVVWLDDRGLAALRDPDGVLYLRTTKEVFEREALGEKPGPQVKPLRPARQLGNEAAAIGALKTISTAQALFREGDKDQNGILDYAGGIEDLGKCQLIDDRLASGEKNGYRFAVTSGAKAPEFLWMAVASPLDEKQGLRHFAISHEGVVYESDKPFELDGVECKIKGGKPVGR
ncbi:MAG: hypothetical protein AB7N76_17675 [Planctomycetota bacterium]